MSNAQLRYVLQRVNTHVFKNPREVMQNIFGVTEYLRTVIRAEGGVEVNGVPIRLVPEEEEERPF